MNKPDPHHSLVSARWMLRLSMLSVVLLLVWAGLSHIDQVTRAQGQVIAVSRTQSVQAPDGGPVKQILVKEGEAVKQGQLLMVLEQDRIQTSLNDSRAKVAALRISLARLRAEVYGQTWRLLGEGKYLGLLVRRFKSSETQDRRVKLANLNDTLAGVPAGLEVRTLFQNLLSKDGTAPVHDPARLQHQADSFALEIQRRTTLTQYIANTLIGLGLFGTFLGLIVTLKEVAALIGLFGVAGSGGSDMMAQFFQKMSAPLPGMGDAFVASLLGLGGSIVNNVQLLATRKLQRVLCNRAEAAYMSVADAVCVPANGQPDEQQMRNDFSVAQAQLQEIRSIRNEMHQQTEAVLLASSRMRQASEPLVKCLEGLEKRTAAQAQDRPQLEQIAATMFAHDIVVWPTSDISSIAIRMDGPQLNLQHDKLLLDVPLALDASLPAVTGKMVGGVAGLTYGYEGSSHRLTISKTSGAALSGLEARAILKAIQLQNATPSAGDRSASITLTDQAGNSNTVVAKLSVDLTLPSSISAALVSSKQISYKTLSIPDIMGGSSPHNLHSGESVDLTSLLPAGMTATSFISSLKGMYAEWGGMSITSDANTTDPHYISVYSFPSGFGLGTTFSMVHQGGPYAKGESFKFTSPDGKQLLLSALDGFYAANTDVFSYKTPSGSQQYDIGNVRLLYQVTTENPNSLPTLRVSYDGTKASAGDVIGLYEGSQLIGSRTLTAADVGAANMSLEVTSTSSLGAGEHVITPKLSDAAGNVVVGNGVSVTLAAGRASPLLSNLKVNGETPDTQSINDSGTKYAMIAETPTSAATLTGLDQNLTFSGTVGGAGTNDTYLISVSMGGKVIVFASRPSRTCAVSASTCCWCCAAVARSCCGKVRWMPWSIRTGGCSSVMAC
ncbi:biotin/lipoyl-binding protein [Herbaspirillum huttiense]|uniref:biotin/lipoyl-binding protein n=1 Tax=Herbaspirillum huttiense TaxID=863372 RepID=UPI003877AA6B